MFGDCEEGSRKLGFALDWMLSGWEGDSMTRYLNSFYLESRRNEAKAQATVGNEVAIT